MMVLETCHASVELDI